MAYSTAGLTPEDIAQGYRINEAGELVLVIDSSVKDYVDNALAPDLGHYLPWLGLGFLALLLLKRKR